LKENKLLRACLDPRRRSDHRRASQNNKKENQERELAKEPSVQGFHMENHIQCERKKT
jgi:hypothetical protein